MAPDQPCIDLKVFLLEQPAFEGFLEDDVGLKISSVDQYTTMYGWFPRLSGGRVSGDCLAVRFYHEAAHYACQTALRGPNLKGRGLPKPFVHRMQKNYGRLAADRDLLGILREFPWLPGRFPAYEPVWSLARFADGRPLFQVSISSQPESEAPLYAAQVALADYLAKRHLGRIWDPQHHVLGLPNPNELYQAALAFPQNGPRVHKLAT